MQKTVFCTFVLMLCIGTAMAQDKQLSFGPTYSLPLGKLTWSYKNSPGFQIHYRTHGDKSRSVWTSVEYLLGYTSLRPVADTLYFLSDVGGSGGVKLGTAVFSPYRMLQVAMMFNAQVDLGKKAFLDLSGGLGAFYCYRSMAFRDNVNVDASMTELVLKAAVMPRAGLGYRLNDNVSVASYVTYNLVIELGSNDPLAADYNRALGTAASMLTTGICLNVNID